MIAVVCEGVELLPERIEGGGFLGGLLAGDAFDEGGFGGDVVRERLEGGFGLRGVLTAGVLGLESASTLLLVCEQAAVFRAHAGGGGVEGGGDAVLLGDALLLELLTCLVVEGFVSEEFIPLGDNALQDRGILGLGLLVESLLFLELSGEIGRPCLGGAVRVGHGDHLAGGEALLAALGSLQAEVIELLLGGGATGLDRGEGVV